MSEQLNSHNHEAIHINEQLQLRAVSAGEADEVFRQVDNNREYLGEFLPWVKTTHSVQDSSEFIRKTKQERDTGEAYGFGIYLDDSFVGHISLMHVKDGVPEIGYWITKDTSGKGVTTQAAEAVTRFGFSDLNLPEIVIKADPKNIPSNRIAEKLGYVLSGSEANDNGEKLNVWRKNQ